MIRKAFAMVAVLLVGLNYACSEKSEQASKQAEVVVKARIVYYAMPG